MDWGQRALLLQNQASEEAGRLPHGLYELVTTRPAEQQHLVDVWVSYSICLRVPGIVVQRPRTALAGREDSLGLQGPLCQW